MRAQVVLLRDDQILLACHKRGEDEFWVLPGGAVEPGETAEQAAIRETREETGLEIRVERLLYIEIPDEGSPIPIRSPRYTYLAVITGGTLEFRQDGPSDDPTRGHLAGAEWKPMTVHRYDEATKDTLRRVLDALAKD